jgi:hypothetical protein
VTGTCPECGHGFGWADLYDPSRQDVRWYVGHARGVRSFLWRSLRTCIAIAVPWKFWRQMGVDRRVHVRLLILFVAYAAVLAHLLVTTVVFVTAVGMNNTAGIWKGDLIGGFNQIVGAFVGLPDQDAREFAFQSLLWPVLINKPGTLWMGDQSLDELVLSIYPLGVGVMWLILMLVLPTTRRLARLRFAHVGRAFLLHASAAALVCGICRGLTYCKDFFYGIPLEAAAVFCTFGFFVWSVIWWMSALWIGWRIRSRLLLLLGTSASVLGMPVVMMPILILYGALK